MDRTALLIDAGYLDKLCQDVFAIPSGGRKQPLALDFKRLGTLAETRPWRTYYYFCLPYQDDPPQPAQFAAREAKKRFTDFLGRLKGWELREGRLEKRGDALVQKRVDVLLAVDLTRMAWLKEVQRVVLISGDADFVPAVEDARRAGVHLTLLYAPGTAHVDLIAACDAARPLTREGLEAIRLT